MFCYVQVLLCILSLHYVTSTPIFGEISFKKDFDFKFKPPPLPPLKFSFLKEILTPFGSFKATHAIQRRDLDSIKPVDPKLPDDDHLPVEAANRYEVIEPKVEVTPGSTPRPFLLTTRPWPLSTPPPYMSSLPPLVSSRPPPPPPPPPTISTPPPFLLSTSVPPPSPMPIRPVTPVMGPELHFRPTVSPQFGWIPITSPIPAPPSPPVVITPPPPKPPKPAAVGLLPSIGPGLGLVQPASPLLNTNIGRDEILTEYLKTIERENLAAISPLPPVADNAIEPEKPKTVEPKAPEPTNPFVRGSRLAIYFGNFLLDVLTQFIGKGFKPPAPAEGSAFF